LEKYGLEISWKIAKEIPGKRVKFFLEKGKKWPGRVRKNGKSKSGNRVRQSVAACAS
jgi:hypothetical protein